MDRATTSLTLFVDLGDVFTKVLASSGEGSRRFRQPSVVSHRLMEQAGDQTELLLADEDRWPAPAGFDPERYPRTRSYPGAARVLEEARPVPGARFAGWTATKYGADRQLLGRHPTVENVEALARKALLSARAGGGQTTMVLVVDGAGAKARAVRRYASGSPHHVTMTVRKLRDDKARRMDVTVDHVLLDWVACAVEALPARLDPAEIGRLLLVDVGYERAKLAIVSGEGCEHQSELPGLGASDCVRRLVRDGRERGLVEDELALMRALERSHRDIEVAGRRFDVGAAFDVARRELHRELHREVRATLLDHYGRRAEPCRAVAVMGGGAAVVGEALAASLRDAELGIRAAWVAPDPGFLLVEGARRLHGRMDSRAKEREVSRV